MSQELTQEFLKQCLDYNAITGIFTWKIRPIEHFKNIGCMKSCNNRVSGKEAGCLGNRNYLTIRLANNIYQAHRLAWFYENGKLPINYIDHINGIKTDNRILNLREASASENQQNIKSARSDNKSTGLLGASFHAKTNKFQSAINVNNKRKYLGLFLTAEEAHNAYLSAKRELHPFGEL